MPVYEACFTFLLAKVTTPLKKNEKKYFSTSIVMQLKTNYTKKYQKVGNK
jgi:hypothetical protein